MQSDTRSRRGAAVFVITCVLSVLAAPAGARQVAGAVEGRLFNSLSLEPVTAGSVTLEELGRTIAIAADGTYRFEGVPPGRYHLLVQADGYVPTRQELTVGAAVISHDVAVDPELHYSEVISVSPGGRDQFESYQPTSVLAGQDLARELEATIGATLESQPGVAERSFGPGSSRPVIRGLDGDRVLILEDGQRSGDLSSQSGDHGVNVNPASAERLEIVRGPATLLYGANAIGGLVNVISNDVPTAPVSKLTGGVTADFGSAATDGGAAADVSWGTGRYGFHAGGGGRGSDDVSTPQGEVENSQSRAAFANIGGSWTTSRGYVGASYGYDDSKYGIPFVEEGNIQLTPRRHVVNLRGEARELASFVESLRVSVGIRRYRHDELEGEEVGTQFENNTVEAEALAGHRAYGRLKGTFGGWALTRAFEAVGEEALSPPVDQRGVAGFAYEELTWPHATFQFGARVEHARFEPEGGLRSRDFTNLSGSVGLLVRPTDQTTIAVSVARASRNPALEELYFNGPHPGNFAFEIGNQDLDSEHALGTDLSFRWRHHRVSGEITYFRNAIADYIFRNPTGEVVDDFPVIEFVAADSVLEGIEAHLDGSITGTLSGEVGFDYVRGTLTDLGRPLPRIPPLRGRAGLRYQKNAFQAGGQVVLVAEQDRVFGEETPTAGYQLLNLFSSWSFPTGAALSTLTARLDNAIDELYRNHLSFIKDFVPEMGRNFKVIYSVRF
jgi:iron complex outermembrane receptor protein